MKITGLKECLKRLESLDHKVQKKILRKSLRQGAKLPLTLAKATAPVRTGFLKKSLKVRSGRGRKGIIRILVGTGAKWFKGAAFYAAFVIFGYKVGSRKLGDKRKQVAPNPFLSNAYEQTKHQVVNTTRNSILSEIAKETKGLNK